MEVYTWCVSKKNLLNQVSIRRSFYTAKMREDKKTLQFIYHVRHMATDPKRMDVNVDENYIALAIPCGLRKRIEHLIVAIETTTGDRKLTLKFVNSRLLQQEQQIIDRVKENIGIDADLVGSQFRKKPSKLVLCYNCEIKCHIQKNCFMKQRDGANKNQEIAAEPSVHVRLNDDFDEGVAEPDYICVITTGDNKATNGDWIFDSFATSHMNFD